MGHVSNHSAKTFCTDYEYIIDTVMSTDNPPVDSAPLIIRTYNDDSASNTFLLTRYDYPVSSNFVLRTSANGALAPSDTLTQTTMGMSSMTISSHVGSTIVYDTFSSATLFLPSGVFDTIVKTTMLVSSLTASTVFLNRLNICTMNVSTFSPNGVTVFSTTLSSTVQTSSITYSTLSGDSLFANEGFISTLFGSSISAKSVSITATASDASRFSTLTTASTSVGFLSFSTLQGSTHIASTLSGSSIYTNPLTVSTLDGRLLTMSTVSCTSTLFVSSLYANGLTFSTASGSSMTISTITAPLLQSNSLFFSVAQGSTVSASSMTVSSLYGSLLVGSTIQANALVFSTLTGSSINASNLTYSTVQGSTMLVSTVSVSTLLVGALSASTLLGSSLTLHTILLTSTLIGSTISWSRAILSTLQGSSAIVSSVTVSTVSGSTVSAGSLQGSTLVVSTVAGSSLNANLLVGSTITSHSLLFSTLSASTLVSDPAVFSTLQGSTAILSTMTVSSLFVSTATVSTLNGGPLFGNIIGGSTLQTNSIVVSTLNGSTLLLSTLTSCTINAQTIDVSVLQGSIFTMYSLTGSTMIGDQLTVSTLIGCTIITDYIRATSTCTGSGSFFLSTFAISTQQTSAAFFSTLTIASTLTVSTLNRINPANFTASTLTLSVGLQSNTVNGLVVCSSLKVNEMNFSRSIVNQPVYGNTVKTNSVVASGLSLVRTSGLRATIDHTSNRSQTYTFGQAIPNRWIAACDRNNVLSYSNDGFNWAGVGSTILGNGRIAVWNGTVWVAVGDTAGITPAKSGITSNTWTQNGATWTASSSTTLGGWPSYFAFDTLAGSDINAWAAGTNNYNSTGTYTGTVTTTVSDIPSSVSLPSPSVGTSVAGEWLQLQSSIPLSISSYTWGSANINHQIKSFCLVGSNDGTTWYFIQYVSYPSSPCTTGYASISTPLFAYYTGTQVVTGNVSVNATTISSAFRDSTYTYFRMIGIQTIPGANGLNNMYMETGEWSITFARNSIAYSYDGIKWTGLGSTIFTNNGLDVVWNGDMWIAVGGGTNSIAYSYDGINWSGLGTGVMTSFGHAVAWNGRIWVTVGGGTNTIAYSYDGIVWRGLGNATFSSGGYGVAWNGLMYVAVGDGTNTIAYSYDSINWNGLGSILFTTGIGVAWNGTMWVALGTGANTIAYSYDGINWTGLGNSVFTGARKLAWNGNMWIAGGSGANTLAYSYNGINWFGLGNVLGTGALGMATAFNSARPHRITFPTPMMIATGSGTNTLAYSTDGINWSGNGLGMGVFTTQGNGIATNGTIWVATGSGTNTLAYSTSVDTPFIHLPFENGLYADVMGNSTIVAPGSPAFVRGTIGSNAVNLMNTAGSTTVSQYLDGNCTLGTTFSVSLWFRLNTLPATANTWSTIIALGSSSTMSFQIIYLTSAGSTGLAVQYKNASNSLVSISSGTSISAGIWYHCTVIFRASGLCLVSLNNNVIGGGQGGGLYTPITNLRIGYDLTSSTSAFNGYIDNVRVYNYAIAIYTELLWRGLGTSVFSTQGKGVAWNGTMWVAVGSGTNSIAYSYDGVTWTGAGTDVLTQGNGVAWNGSMWVAVGSGTNSIAYSYNGITWTGLGNILFNGNGVAWNGTMWVAVGSGANPIAYSYDGMTWSGLNLTNTAVPPAYLPFENSAVDSFSKLTFVSTVGSVTYSSSIYKVGNYSAYFANTAGASTTSANYLKYTIPSSLYSPSVITMSCWIYPTAYPPSFGSSAAVGFNNDSSASPGALFQLLSFGAANFSVWTTTSGSASLTSLSPVTLHAWTHLVGVYSSGVVSFYMNGVLQATSTITGNLSISFGTVMTHLYVGAAYPTGGVYAGYVDDVRIYTCAFTQSLVTSLYNSPSGQLYPDISSPLFTSSGNGIAWNGVRWIAVGSGGNTILYSTDGITWTVAASSCFTTAGNGVTWNGSRWVATGSGTNTIGYSVDGSTWTGSGISTLTTAGSGIVANNVLSGTVAIQHPVVAVGQGIHTLAYSPDGIQWTGLGTTIFGAGYSVCWNGSLWMAGGLGTHTLAYSYDGLRWTGLGSTLFSIQTNGVAWNGSMWVAVGSGTNSIAYSKDGLTWTGSANTNFTSCNAVAWNGSIWVAVGTGAKSIAYSADGITWTAISTTDVFTQGNGVCWTGSLWVAVGAGTNTIAYSTNGTSWTGLGTAMFNISGNGVCWNGTRCVAVGTGSSHTIAYSANGTSWVGFGKTLFPSAGNGVCWTGMRFVAVGDDAIIGYSQNGLTWYVASSSIFTQGNGVAGNPRIGAMVCDSQVALSDSLDVVSDTYYNTGYTNFSATIQSQKYAVDRSAVTTTLRTQPGVPTGVSGALYPSGTASSIRVSFTYPANTGGGVDAYYASAIDTLGVQPTVTASSPSQPIRIKGLVPGTTYRFQVYSSNSAGQSAPAESASNLLFQVPPSVIQNYTVALNSLVNPTGMVVSFTAPAISGGITNYTAAAYIGSTPIGASQTGTGLSYTFTGFTGGTVYNFSAVGTNTGGTGAVSNLPLLYYSKPDPPTVGAITLQPPAAPTGVNVAFTAPTNTGGATLTYVATAYSGATAVASSVSSSSSPLYITGLTANTSYTYRIVASNTVIPTIVSDASIASAATTYASKPVAPTLVSASIQFTQDLAYDSLGRRLFSYTTNLGTTVYSGTRYISVIFTDSVNVGGTFSYTATASNGSTSFSSTGTSPLNITGLSGGIIYTISVTATNSNGITSNASNTTTLYYIALPSAPLNIIGLDSNRYTSWSAPSDNGGNPVTSYLVRFDGIFYIRYTPNITLPLTGASDYYTVYASNDNIYYGLGVTYSPPICSIS